MTSIVRGPRGADLIRRLSPLPGGRRRPAIGLFSLLALTALAAESAAQEKSRIPAFDGGPVYVGKGIPGDFGPIERQISRLEKAGYQYYVAVVRSAGPESRTATSDYAKDLYKVWQAQARARGLTLDPARSVVVVVAIENRQVIVHPGTDLRALGLRGDAIDREVIEPSGFLTKAADGQFPEAIAALLDRTDSWLADHDGQYRRTVASKQVPATVATTPPVTPAVAGAGRSLAIGLGLAALALLAAILGGFWLRHRRTRDRLDQRIKGLRSRATDVMDRLDALKERVKLLPASDPDFRTPMAGETAALYAKIQGVVSQLWDRWLQVMDAIDRAQKAAVGFTSPLKRKAIQDAEAQLNQEGLFEQIDAGAKAAAADMDRLDQAHEAARKELESVAATRPQVDAQVEVIRKLGLPIAPYQEELAAIANEAEKARGLLDADPIGVRSMLEALRSRAEALIARAGRVAGLVQEAQKLAASLEGMRRQVAEHRSKGLRLDEGGGNPDPSLEAADRAHAGAVAALRSGQPDEAAKELDTGRSLVEQARSLVEQVRGAREYCRREQPERLRATERLRAALPQAQADYHRLETDFAPASWDVVRTNLDQIHRLLETFDHSAADAASASTDDAQHYLAGARMLRQLAQQQQTALRLMSAIGDRLNALSAARDDCRRRRSELEATTRRVEDFIRRNDPSVGTMTLDVFQQARHVRDAVLAAFEWPRPDWPSLQDGMNKALEGLSVAQNQAEVDVRSHRQLADEYERARAELERLADLLSSRREDRMAANQRFRSAAEVLDQVGVDLSRPHGEWPGMLEQVRGAARDLAQAERLAHEDIRLAAQAQAEIDEARRSIGQAGRSYAMGIGADTSAAEAALGRAERLLMHQQYEQAIEGASQAQMAARRAEQDALQQVSWRQMQADSERRHWQGGSDLEDALRTGASVAAGVILGHAMEGAAQASEPDQPAPPEPAYTPEPPDTDTSVSSWESDTGQGSW